MIRIRKTARPLKNRPKVAFFEMSSCEGCQLQLLNREAGLLKFLNSIEIVHFREGMTKSSADYDIAFIEGSVSNAEQIVQLKLIRRQAQIVVALGTCACFGGVNQLFNQLDNVAILAGNRAGQHCSDTQHTQPLDRVIRVDEKIYGCPVRKRDVENVLENLLKGQEVVSNTHSVCFECKQHNNICLLDKGEPCLGSVTRAGCDAWCTTSHVGCWGCRGPASLARPNLLRSLSKRKGVDLTSLTAKLSLFGGFGHFLAELQDEEGNEGGKNVWDR